MPSMQLAVAQIVQPEQQVYSGRPLTPDVEINDEDDYNVFPLIRNRDYVLRYQDNVSPGTATLVINGIGRYYGEETVTFEISYPETVLSDDGNVVANYDAENNRLVISGHGQINRQKWIGMAKSPLTFILKTMKWAKLSCRTTAENYLENLIGKSTLAMQLIPLMLLI